MCDLFPFDSTLLALAFCGQIQYVSTDDVKAVCMQANVVKINLCEQKCMCMCLFAYVFLS